MVKETKRSLDVYSLIITNTDIIIPIPCVNELKTKTQLANIDLFTSHFTDAKSLIDFCNKKNWINYQGNTKKLLVQFGSGKRIATRPVIYKDDEVVSGFANRDDTTCNKENLESFVFIWLENMRQTGTFIQFLEKEKIFYLRATNVKEAKGNRKLSNLIYRYFEKMGAIKAELGDTNQNEKAELEEEKNETVKQISKKLEDNYRLVRDLCFGIKNYNILHDDNKLREPKFKIETESLDSMIPKEKDEQQTAIDTKVNEYIISDWNSVMDPDRNSLMFNTDGFDNNYDDDSEKEENTMSKGKQKSLSSLPGNIKIFED